MPSTHQPLYEACLQQALVLSRDWVPRWLTKLSESLDIKESSAFSAQDKHLYHQARKQLTAYQELVGSRFIEKLAAALPQQGSEASPSVRRLDHLSLDDLELMDDHQVHETVEQGRVLQIVKMAVDEDLVTFNALLSRTRGLSVVKPDANPLRPDVLVQALMKTLETLHVEASIRSSWFHCGAVALGQELQGFYQALSQWLMLQGVQPAGYVVTQLPDPKAPATLVATQAQATPSTSAAEGGDLLTLDHLHQLLVGNMVQTASQVTGEGGAGSGSAMVQTLAAEVVSLMMRSIIDDVRLLAPIRTMLAGLKPSLLEMARSDPRFFADRQNPARRLLDAITERALAFTSDQDPGFAAFAEQVRQSVVVLQSNGPQMAERLELQLLNLKQIANPILTPERGRAVQTLVKVEQRNLLAQRVAAEMEARNDFARAPGVVRRFLLGPWAQVVAQARLEADAPGIDLPEDAPAHRYMAILPDLLWSSQLALASRNRPRLIKVIPPMLRALREGLDSIDYPRAQSDAFFQALMGLHEAAYKTLHREVAVSPEPESVMPEADDESDDAWLRPAEARDTGFMEDVELSTQPAFQDTEPMSRDWADLRAEVTGPSSLPLELGTWVDLWREDRVVRCQLTWSSPHGTMFLFNSPDGRSVSLTRRGLLHILESGRLRVVAQHGMVDDALDAVARQAWINSLKT
jgi:Protein of unknown function (DUF1631)